MRNCGAFYSAITPNHTTLGNEELRSNREWKVPEGLPYVNPQHSKE